jgi:hypothetical protein
MEVLVQRKGFRNIDLYEKASGVGGPTPAQKGKRGWVMTNR